MIQQTIIAGQPWEWEVDQAAAARAAPWAKRQPERLAADVAGMAAYFPHWLLCATSGGAPARCPECAAHLVPAAGAIRCPAWHALDSAAIRADGLAWIGHLPALARPEPAFERRRAALAGAGFEEARAGGLDYLLVPLLAAYPREWPGAEPLMRYSGRWLDAAGLPRANAGYHLIGQGQACIFAYGQWQAAAIHEVIQHRMANHVASLFKIMAGQPAAKAFIGRIHHDDWQAER